MTAISFREKGATHVPSFKMNLRLWFEATDIKLSTLNDVYINDVYINNVYTDNV